MPTQHLASPKFRALDANGNPLSGGLLYSYAAGTSTPLATYTTRAGSVANANPVVLDANGEADVWTSTGVEYKFELRNSAGVVQWTVDNVPSVPAEYYSLSDGNVSAPGLAFASDPNTGLYRVGADSMAVAAGGTQAQRWTAAGTVVPGTLSVSGASTLTGAITAQSTLAVTGASTLTGAVTAQTGQTVTQATANATAVVATGNGTGAGAHGTGGATSGSGLVGTGGAPNGAGATLTGSGVGAGVVATGGASDGLGGNFTGGASNGGGLQAIGDGTGTGVYGVGGDASGTSVRGVGGSPDGRGGRFEATGNADGVSATTGGSTTYAAVRGDSTGAAFGGQFSSAGGSGVGLGCTGNATSAPLRIFGLASAPSTPSNGDVYYDTSTNKLRVRAGGVWVDLH